jgi:hypothetical protein
MSEEDGGGDGGDFDASCDGGLTYANGTGAKLVSVVPNPVRVSTTVGPSDARSVAGVGAGAGAEDGTGTGTLQFSVVLPAAPTHVRYTANQVSEATHVAEPTRAY